MIAMDKQREETVLYLQNQVTELRANAERQHRLLIICTAVLGLFLFSAHCLPGISPIHAMDSSTV